MPEATDEVVATTRTIAFVDCCGFTSFTAARGNRAALKLHQALRQGLEDSVAVLPVEIVKWMGDGAMLASEDTTIMLDGLYRAMVRAQDTGSLPVRAGIAAGPVMRSTRDGVDYIGKIVNRAAHLCDAADPWQVRMSSETEAVLHLTLRRLGEGAPRWMPHGVGSPARRGAERAAPESGTPRNRGRGNASAPG